jgi:protein TonB
MFRETLLESSPQARKGKRWPMATAFAVEAMVAAALILIPLFSAAIIPALARVPAPPLRAVALADRPTNHTPSGRSTGPHTPNFVPISVHSDNMITYESLRPASDPGDRSSNEPIGCLGNCVPDSLPDVGPSSAAPRLEPTKRIRLSVLSEGQLVRRVEPVYPRTAVLIHLHGVVKLHALIAKDGTVQSLNVISGHPLLATAALDAVRQWRYRPYILNGDPVEVETFITVTFRGE